MSDLDEAKGDDGLTDDERRLKKYGLGKYAEVVDDESDQERYDREHDSLQQQDGFPVTKYELNGEDVTHFVRPEPASTPDVQHNDEPANVDATPVTPPVKQDENEADETPPFPAFL